MNATQFPAPYSLTARFALDDVGCIRRTGELLKHLEPCCNYAIEAVVEAEALVTVVRKVDPDLLKAVSCCVASTYIHVLYYDIQERCPSPQLTPQLASSRGWELDKATRVRLQNLLETVRAQKRFSWSAFSNDYNEQARDLQDAFHRLARETGAMQLGESMTDAIHRLETELRPLPPARQPSPFPGFSPSYLTAPLNNGGPQYPSPTRFDFPDPSVSYARESSDRTTEPVPGVVVLEYQPSVRTDMDADSGTDSPSPAAKRSRSNKTHLSAPKLKTSSSSLSSKSSKSSRSSHSRPHTPTPDATGYHQYPYDAYHSHCHGGYPPRTPTPGAPFPYDFGQNMANALHSSSHGNAFINVGNDNSKIIYNYEGKKKRKDAAAGQK